MFIPTFIYNIFEFKHEYVARVNQLRSSIHIYLISQYISYNVCLEEGINNKDMINCVDEVCMKNILMFC